MLTALVGAKREGTVSREHLTVGSVLPSPLGVACTIGNHSIIPDGAWKTVLEVGQKKPAMGKVWQ